MSLQISPTYEAIVGDAIRNATLWATSSVRNSSDSRRAAITGWKHLVGGGAERGCRWWSGGRVCSRAERTKLTCTSAVWTRRGFDTGSSDHVPSILHRPPCVLFAIVRYIRLGQFVARRLPSCYRICIAVRWLNKADSRCIDCVPTRDIRGALYEIRKRYVDISGVTAKGRVTAGEIGVRSVVPRFTMPMNGSVRSPILV